MGPWNPSSAIAETAWCHRVHTATRVVTFKGNDTGTVARVTPPAALSISAATDTLTPESGINATIAGHCGVPVVMVSGDESAVAEVQKLTGNVEGAVVKRSISFHAAAVMPRP